MGKRIAYIDAMRGFTMILVVYSHICGFCLGDTRMGWNGVMFLFRLPCFFFISGWLFEPVASRPLMLVARRKFMVQIVPTFIFLLLLAPPPLFFSRLGATKGGYWFTFALFVFFMLYMLSVRLGRRWGALLAVVLSFAAFSYDIYYNRLVTTLPRFSPYVTYPLGLLSFMTWRYYLFFFVGAWVRRHFDVFLRWTGRPIVVAATVVGFAVVAMLPPTECAIREYLVFAVGGILGLTVVFTFFRRFAAVFAEDRLLGRCLQFVGTRTLDIYLLHYFLLPRFLLPYGPELSAMSSPLLELLVVLPLAVLVVAACLLVSRVIRFSPFLAHYLFGVKKYDEDRRE